MWSFFTRLNDTLPHIQPRKKPPHFLDVEDGFVVMVGILACGLGRYFGLGEPVEIRYLPTEKFQRRSNNHAFCALFIDSNGLGMDVSTKGFWVHRESGVAAALPLG